MAAEDKLERLIVYRTVQSVYNGVDYRNAISKCLPISVAIRGMSRSY